MERETKKWLKRLEDEMKGIKSTTEFITSKKAIESVLENINAYISDCKHFLAKGDMILAFEAVIYAWGMFDALKKCNLVQKY